MFGLSLLARRRTATGRRELIMPEADCSASDEADVRSFSGESPLARALAGGESQRVGWFRLCFDDERSEWSREVERMHGYEPATVQPTTKPSPKSPSTGPPSNRPKAF